MKWMRSLQINVQEGVIAIDGKSSRHTFDEGQKPLHLVSAFASEARLVLAQEKVPDKTNEITAIKTLLDWLDIRGSIVSIDAMGCQTDIANKIVQKEGDYLLSLKENQGSLQEDISTFFDSEVDNKFSNFFFDHHKTVEKGHGRIETRNCFVCNNVEWLRERHTKWPHLKAIICVQSERQLKNKTTSETRYFITSRDADAPALLQATRSHWSIENSLHWVLDMSFGDDQSRIRKENSPMNMAILKHISLNMVRNAKAKMKRMSIRRLRLLGGWDDSVLHNLISQNMNLI